MYNSSSYTPSSAAADFGSVFGTLDPQKCVFGVGEVLFFRNSCFFASDSFLERFLSVFGWFWERFWEPKRYQNGLKERSRF